ncbi:MAG: putative 2-aminoethylphosphonate ABC transporter substrate-binding protein [Clostridium sp.]
MKKRFISLALAVATMTTLFVGCGSTNKTGDSKKELTIYTALEEDQINDYLEGYKAKYPDVELNIVRDSTGVITSKLIAEGENTSADIIWGLAATSLLVLDEKGMLEGYAPEGVDRIDEKFKGDGKTPTWVGIDIFENGIGINKTELDKLGLKAPTSFEDLLNPAYANMISMPNPASSGTGFLVVAGILEHFGEEEGWKYLEKLHENIKAYTHSGSRPAVMTAQGETNIGLALGYRIIKEKQKGGQIDIAFPTEGICWDLEANALVKKDSVKPEAKEFLDWAITDEAMDKYQKSYPMVTIDKEYEIPAEYGKNPKEKLMNVNLKEVAKKREAILTKWSEKFDSKSEPKN